MSQFGFGQQIGQQRDALGGSSRSNYASEEADLTDGLIKQVETIDIPNTCLLYTSPSPRDLSTSRMPSSA